jgi:hypothetical protein
MSSLGQAIEMISIIVQDDARLCKKYGAISFRKFRGGRL